MRKKGETDVFSRISIRPQIFYRHELVQDELPWVHDETYGDRNVFVTTQVFRLKTEG